MKKVMLHILFIQTYLLKIILPHTPVYTGRIFFAHFCPEDSKNLLELFCLSWWVGFYASFIERMLILPHNKLFLQEKLTAFSSCPNIDAQLLITLIRASSQTTKKWIQFSKCRETCLMLINKSKTSPHQQIINELYGLI